MDKKKFNLSGQKVALLVTHSAIGGFGGAERFFRGLEAGLKKNGYDVDIINIPSNESTFENIIKNYDYAKNLDLSNYEIVISSKAPSYAVKHHNHILYLMHTVRVFDDLFDFSSSVESFKKRALINKLDYEAISKIKYRFSQSYEVRNRLFRWIGFDSEVIHPPLEFYDFETASVGDYFFIASRLHPLKRIDLIIRAVQKSQLPLKLIIAGKGEDEDRLKKIALGDQRIKFIGEISDVALKKYYSNALAIPFVPEKEDFGYVTMEAFRSAKAIITCTDSGEPTLFVKNFITGLVCKPNENDLSNSLDWAFNNKNRIQEMGINAYNSIKSIDINWEDVAKKLCIAALSDAKQASGKMEVSVLDMQPIIPAVGGGRLKILGLYHNLGENINCRYVGTYDWPGEKQREHFITKNLKEINIPLSGEHFKAIKKLNKKTNGKNVVDIAFSQQGHLSKEYIERVKEEIKFADVIIFSHPWVFPLIKENINVNQMVIYDSHNVEGFLRAQLLDENNSTEKKLLYQLIQDEYDILQRADWVLACSHEDRLKFNLFYETSFDKIRIFPNGVMTKNHEITISKNLAKKKLGIPNKSFTVIFIGSPYGPNFEAANFIINNLAPNYRDIIFIVAGGVGDSLKSKLKNVIITGSLGEKEKAIFLRSSDIAINPMFSGSGTNIKMFEYMAYGLPIISSDIGARGIELPHSKGIVVTELEPNKFKYYFDKLKDPGYMDSLSSDARNAAEIFYSWENISNQLGHFLNIGLKNVNNPKPLFSIIIPTYNRHEKLSQLMKTLQEQVERDFEVIIIDQSEGKWTESNKSFGFQLYYIQSPVKGAVHARNYGANIAKGDILAFVDDDCLPSKAWLLNARPYFDNPKTIGIEGLIVSDHLNDANWRPVTNVNFKGIGFMTANLMVRTSIFNKINGFDHQFDNPHFREDTDFGWRAQEYGDIPFAQDVEVFHPAQDRKLLRESASERNKFFIKDALLYKKHPVKYYRLYKAEKHYLHTDGFKENFIKGFKDNNIKIPEWFENEI